MSLQQNNGDYIGDLAWALYHQNKPDEAAQAARSGLALGAPYYYLNFASLGEVLIQRDQFGDALPLLLQSLRLYPDNINCVIRLGEAFAKIGKTKFSKDKPNMAGVLALLDTLLADSANSPQSNLITTLAQCKAFLTNLSDTSILPISFTPLATWKDGFFQDEIPYNLKIKDRKPYDNKLGGYPVTVTYSWSGSVTGQHEEENTGVVRYRGGSWVVERQ